MTRRWTLPLALAASLAWTSSSAAQVLIPPEGTWQDLGLSVAGHFTDESCLDVVQIRQGNALHLFQPPVYAQIMPIVDDITTVALLPGGGENGLDGIVCGGSDGLKIGYVDMDATPSPVWAYTEIDTTYTYPRRLVVDDLDGDSNPDLLELSSDGLTIRIYDDVITYPTGTPSSITLPGAAFGMVTLDWNGSGAKDIGITRTGWTGVLDRSGTTLYSVNRGSYLSRIAAATGGPSGVHDRLVATFFVGGRDRLQWMYLDDNQSPALQESSFHDLGFVEMVGIASGRLDDDDIDDLVLSYEADYELRFLYSKSGSVSNVDYFDGNDTETIDIDPSDSGPATDNVAVPSIGDFDNDTDRDVLFALQSGPAMYYVPNPPALESTASHKPTLDDTADNEAEFVAVSNDPDTPEKATLRLHFDKAASFQDHDKLQLVVWRRDAAAADPLLENDAYKHIVTDLTSDPTQVDVILEDGDLTNGTVWELVVRTFKSTVTPREVSAAWLGSFYTSETAKDALDLEFGYTTPDFSVQALLPAQSGGSNPPPWTATVTTGIFIPMMLPCYQDETVPTVPGPQPSGS